MAIIESIPEKKQTPSAQKGVLDYCMQPSKTFDEGEQLAYISGYNCIPELANESFLATQKIFGHEPDGVRFYDMVWTPERKYITYICPTQDGKERRVRDIKLNDEKYLKENMEHEFRIRTELYGQAQGAEYSSGTARSDGRNSTGTGASDGSDQRRGMDAANGNGASNGGSVRGAVGTEGGSVERGEQIYREDDEGGRGAERGNGEGSAQDNEGSGRTGWERERESFKSYQQKNHAGRGTVVAPTRSHGSADAVSTALMGARGLGNLTDLFEDGEETEEEKRQREAQNAGTVVGVVAGTITGIAIGHHQNHEPNIENHDEEDEAPQMGMIM